MSTQAELAKKLTERIPQPDEVRERLAENLRESRLLRQLLRVSERAARDRVVPSERRIAR